MTTPTPEAIEAAARALYQDWWNRNEYATSPASPAWEDAAQYHREMYLIRAKVALSAAAPFIAAQALAPIFALHQPVTVYAYDSVNGVFMVDDDGEQIPMTSLCSECTSEDVLEDVGDCEFNEGDGISWPCATVEAVTVEPTP